MQADENRDLSPSGRGDEVGVATPTPSRTALYLLPAAIVLLCVLGWLALTRLVSEEYDAHSLVRDMQQPGRHSWQNAYTLSQLLQDPDYDYLRDDAELCRALAKTLDQQNELAAQEAAAAVEDQQRVRFRAFLCRALGEFRVPDAWPPLLKCVNESITSTTLPRGQQEVGMAALAALALSTDHMGGSPAEHARQALDLLTRASLFTNQADSPPGSWDIASAATFALGVVGSERAIEQLLTLLQDPRSDVRYNAATGLARHGHQQALCVLLEMLAPDETAAGVVEQSDSARARKQTIVWSTAIRAGARLLPALDAPDRRRLIAALQRLVRADHVPDRIRLDARQTLLTLPVDSDSDRAT